MKSSHPEHITRLTAGLRTVAVPVTAALVLTALGGTSASASDHAFTQNSAGVAALSATKPLEDLGFDTEGMTGEEIVAEGLEQEGLEAGSVEIGLDEIQVEAEAQAANDPYAIDLRLDPETAHGTVTVTDAVSGRTVTSTYDIDVETSTPERTVFTLADTDTGRTYDYDSATAQESIPGPAFAIPIAFVGISAATMLYYMAIGAAIVIGGIAALEAGRAVGRIIDENKKRSQDKKRYHYPAKVQNNKVYISGRGLTASAAVARGKKSQDVWSTTKARAKSIAKGVKGGLNPVREEVHGGAGSGHMWHYHPNGRTPHMHSFYGRAL
ncbi:hypothetical protein [Kineosporia babensis]|uniref:Uncharacterized protein n=1 Tax=Kineosporia babensis TaxID=499548 RepID=A0A9X1NIR5_9ACTN|nr:hypothetical protein [Kineosporia babensis]MCD5315782.1 hypothetical protein [Kineosporia babensis]